MPYCLSTFKLAPILSENFWNKKASVSVFWLIEVGDRELGRKDVSLILNVSLSSITAEMVEMSQDFWGQKVHGLPPSPFTMILLIVRRGVVACGVKTNIDYFSPRPASA